MAATGLIKPLALGATATAALLSGSIASITYHALPPMLQAPTADVAAHQWRIMFDRGMALMPKIAATTLGLCLTGAYLSYSAARRPLTHNPRALYLISAGVVTMGIVPFTLGAIGPTNSRLFALQDAFRAGTAGQEALGEVVDLVRKWGVLNLVRACFPLVGSVLAMQAI